MFGLSLCSLVVENCQRRSSIAGHRVEQRAKEKDLRSTCVKTDRYIWDLLRLSQVHSQVTVSLICWSMWRLSNSIKSIKSTIEPWNSSASIKLWLSLSKTVSKRLRYWIQCYKKHRLCSWELLFQKRSPWFIWNRHQDQVKFRPLNYFPLRSVKRLEENQLEKRSMLGQQQEITLKTS